ncbi:Uu.00g031660.m01.CDS01 [Anthostomella pinea]|uniref:Uu.00g031660.m01.CDS01 n=1 Tax=Anthostomella pinea TaxID=933095 RepID=A0AAI8YD84_9PEZI|nr:Uu.00g031660.m01.CDS01 [Anthostomella pinea]
MRVERHTHEISSRPHYFRQKQQNGQPQFGAAPATDLELPSSPPPTPTPPPPTTTGSSRDDFNKYIVRPSTPPKMPLAPPAEGIFPTWAECEEAVQSHAAREGYATVAHPKTKSKRTGQYSRYVIKCDKSGTFQSKAQIGAKRISSKKTGCPFSCTANIREDGCYFKVTVPEHNHTPSASPAEHVRHRRMNVEQRSLVEAGAIARKPVKVIYEDLVASYPDTFVKFEDVSNYVQAWKRRAKDNATGVQALLYRLQEREDIWSFPLERASTVPHAQHAEGGGNGTLEGIFWVPKWTTDLWQRTPDILIIETSHILTRQQQNQQDSILPILEMNSVIAASGAGGNAAGYAILPDRSDATLLWLMGAVDRLRLRLKGPKHAYITVTDFQTAEKNVLAEVNKPPPLHQQRHVVFGRILSDAGAAPAMMAISTTTPMQAHVSAQAPVAGMTDASYTPTNQTGGSVSGSQMNGNFDYTMGMS